jgi:prepilin signal peptidase PulO-like enzyme (type II secretory pathway)
MMEALYYVYLVILGLIFWSFGSVLISRFYSHESGIVSGRSHCTSCGHTLSALDLFPLFSWLFLWWKCRYCKKGISFIYPALELTMAVFFFFSWYMLVNPALVLSWDKMEIIRLLMFLFISFVIVIVSFYDILYQLIPTELLGPAILIFFLLLAWAYLYQPIGMLFTHFLPFDSSLLTIPLINWLLWAVLVYSFFYIQILLPWIYYAIEKKKYKIILTLFIEYFTIPFWILVSPFIKTKVEENEQVENEQDEVYTFMWHWDLWIAIFMWFTAGFKKAAMWLVLAYLIWSVVWVYVIATRKERNIAIAFWPFLWAGLFISLLYYQPILNFYFSILWIK